MTEEWHMYDVTHLMDYLRKGDRILYSGVSGWRQVLRPATVDMDGHKVSSEYGWSQGSHYYDSPERSYINVKFDDVDYSSKRGPNSGIYQRPRAHNEFGSTKSLGRYASWAIYTTRETKERMCKDAALTPEELHPKPDAGAEARDEISKIEQEMRALEARLSQVRQNLG